MQNKIILELANAQSTETNENSEIKRDVKAVKRFTLPNVPKYVHILRGHKLQPNVMQYGRVRHLFVYQ